MVIGNGLVRRKGGIKNNYKHTFRFIRFLINKNVDMSFILAIPIMLSYFALYLLQDRLMNLYSFCSNDGRRQSGWCKGWGGWGKYITCNVTSFILLLCSWSWNSSFDLLTMVESFPFFFYLMCVCVFIILWDMKVRDGSLIFTAQFWTRNPWKMG